MPNIAVIGGGAAGLAAAITAKRLHKSLDVTVFERLPRLGKKILATGNGRCNLSHEPVSAGAYHGSVSVKALLEEFPTVKPFFESLGVLTATDSEGRVYPYSNSAATVLDALITELEQLGINVRRNFTVREITAQSGGFIVKGDNESLFANSIILTAGGCASPVHGSDGSGFQLIRKLGLEITEPAPALCPLKSEKSLLKPVSGVRIKAAVTLERNGNQLKAENGEVQFTDEYLSGICIFNLSNAARKGDTIKLDLMPDYTFEKTREQVLRAQGMRGNLPLSELLCGFFNKKIAEHIVRLSVKKPASTLAKVLSADEISGIAKYIKALPFPVLGAADFTGAQVTAGGVRGCEIDGGFCVKKQRGLFLAGEILDINGDCGGYNLHFAWASGIKAAENAVKYLRCDE